LDLVASLIESVARKVGKLTWDAGEKGVRPGGRIAFYLRVFLRKELITPGLGGQLWLLPTHWMPNHRICSGLIRLTEEQRLTVLATNGVVHATLWNRLIWDVVACV
jgi:hypothetical protein